MIKVSSLISAMQQAAHEASATVAGEQMKILARFFHGVEDGASLASGDALTPVLVRMGFPRETADGPVQHEVYVPLIAMTPMTALQLTELEVELDAEVVIDGEEVLVGTPSRDVEVEGEKTNLKVRMKFDAAGLPDGAQVIIDGFSKALRAQIPT